MARENVSIPTKDGSCDTAVFTPGGAGQWPAVIAYMDAIGPRPAMFAIGETLAQAGFVVLVPDLYYRAGAYPPLDPKTMFTEEEARKKFMALRATTGNQRAGGEDTSAFLAYIDTRKDVAGKKIGTTGYCMGGGISISAAGLHGGRIAAAASFHGGNMATDQADSPHLQAANIKGEVYVAGADKDNSYPPEMAARLEKALSDAGVKHRCEIYADAMHGWTMTDLAIYNQAAAERHMRELTGLMKRVLG
ncbi:MAG: dienelactone hydrolase family protein [Hyphomonadaceae bacterium]